MSADNRICIMPTWDREWAVWHGSASQDYYEAPDGAAKFSSEKEASAYANKLHDEYGYVEYGVQHITEDEQSMALRHAIEDLWQRMWLLRATGKQWEDA